MFSKITGSPLLARVAPFAVFMALHIVQGHAGEVGRYWIYLAKTLAGAGMLLVVWKHIAEAEWRLSWEAVVVGVAVFVMWVGLDEMIARLGWPAYPKLKSSGVDWNPNQTFGAGSPLALFFIVARIAGTALVVPCLEEIFFRSFVYRYLAGKDFLAVPLGKFLVVPFLITSAVFGLEHVQWLAGLLCGFAYQGLVVWKGRLGNAVTAHGITNFLLGVWVVWKGAWQFW